MAISAVESQRVLAWRPVALVATVAAAVHLAVATRYGWHRDEFYYVICGRHPAWGYVDQPPLTPMLARLADLTPDTLLTLRLFAIAAQVGCILLAALLAAEFGGRRVAQIIAAAAVAACPGFVGPSLWLSITLIDQLCWLAVLVLVARALRTGTVTAWLSAGVAAGVGFENKHTVAVLVAGIAVGLLLYRRAVLRSVGPWLAGVLAVLLAVPNLRWEASHGWPSTQLAKVVSRHTAGVAGAITHLPMLAVLLAGPLLVVLWVWGVRWLVSPAGRDRRWVLVAAVLTVVVFTASGGKPYYAAPMLAALFAAGALWVESAVETNLPRALADTGRVPRGWAVAIGASFVTTAVVCLPVLPISAANAIAGLHPDLFETYGWEEFTDQVAAAAASVPAGVPIVAINFGEAGALTILGPAAGLHRPVYSGHNNYALWGPPSEPPDTVLCLGEATVKYFHHFWERVEPLTLITVPNGVHNAEIAGNARVYLCQQPRGSWAEIWPRLSYINT